MCGIAAAIGTENSAAQDEKLVARMLEAIVHRGDLELAGSRCSGPGFVLGCNRLSIVDRAHASQPMSTPDESIWVIQNGQIYNHLDLRRELSDLGCQFQSHSDTEVLLQAYRTWGIDMLNRLDGMFSFVIFDCQERRCFSARDPYGIKPLYYARSGSGLFFGSELKCFRAISLEPTPLPPGTYMVDGTIRRYAHHESIPIHEDDAEGAAKEYRRLLEKAVQKQVQTDLPIGVIFSGGIDSTAILALAQQHHPNVTAFSVGFPGAPDLEMARRIARDLGIRHVVRELNVSNLRSSLPFIVDQLETFETVDLMDGAVMSVAYGLAREEGIKVVLCGDGSDETLAGYDLFRVHPDPKALSDYRLANLHRTDLQRVDRAAMQHSVEARVPFLDSSAACYARSAPLSLKLRAGTEKWLLRRAVSDIVPEYACWRPKIRMPEGTGLLYQLLDHARSAEPVRDVASMADELGIDQPDGRYFLALYLEHGYRPPKERYKRTGWDFPAGGYFQFQTRPGIERSAPAALTSD